MFRRLSKCWRYIKYFFDSKKAWYWPRQSDVLIFDACGQEILLEYLQPWNPEVLHVRNEFINVPVLLSSIFRDGKKSYAYIDCFIEKVRPKLVITFIDNNPDFYAISLRHPSVKTMFIQNGLRARILEGEKPAGTHGKVDYMMVFGSNIGNEYSKYIRGISVSMGSLKNNHHPKNNNKALGTIAFISQYLSLIHILTLPTIYSV